MRYAGDYTWIKIPGEIVTLFDVLGPSWEDTEIETIQVMDIGIHQCAYNDLRVKLGSRVYFRSFPKHSIFVCKENTLA